MKSIAALLSCLALTAVSIQAHLNVVLTNDDGFGSANIRAVYNELKKQNHNVLIVGPADQQSGKGGTTVWPTSNLTGGGRGNFLAAGLPYAGTEPGVDNPAITYFNGTPAACVFYALDVVAPVFFNNQSVDLVVSGVNEGSNLGPLVYTLSGTLGAAYVAVGRGIPAIAVSGQNSTKVDYKDWNPEDPTEVANVQGKLTADLVSALAYGRDKTKGDRVLPPALGLNVNFPQINSTCTGLPMIQTRMTGSALTDKVVFTAAGFPTWGDLPGSIGINTCVSGDCSLPGETLVATTTCQTAVTVFSVDYDAPQGYAESVKEHLEYTVLDKMNTAPGSYKKKRDWTPREAAGILYGVPNTPAYAPNPKPNVPWDLFKGAGLNLMRAGGAQVPAPGWSSGEVKNYEQRFESTKQNYFDTLANGVMTFVLLPHDMWGADSVTKTPIYPCDNGDCTEYGRFLDRVIADLKNNNMLRNIQIDIWNEPDVPLFWDRSQDQYFQMWDYAFNKYRAAFPASSGVTISGPAYTGPPNEGNSWWTKWASHMKANPAVYPDVITYHQLLGRQGSFNDPVESRRVLDIIQSKNNLPRKLTQINEYAGSDEQSPAYSAWFVGRLERSGQQGLRANWGYGRNLHNDFARLIAGVEAGAPYKLGDWHVYNYYTQVQKGSITRAGADDVLWDLFVTQNKGAKQVNALIGSRGQGEGWNSPDFPVTMSSVSTVFGAATKVRAVIKEIPFNRAGRVDAPTIVSNTTYNVSGNKVVFPIFSRVDNAYTIDVYAA